MEQNTLPGLVPCLVCIHRHGGEPFSQGHSESDASRTIRTSEAQCLVPREQPVDLSWHEQIREFAEPNTTAPVLYLRALSPSGG